MNELTKYKVCGNVKANVTGKLLYLILPELSNQDGEIVVPQKKISGALNISQAADYTENGLLGQYADCIISDDFLEATEGFSSKATKQVVATYSLCL